MISVPPPQPVDSTPFIPDSIVPKADSTAEPKKDDPLGPIFHGSGLNITVMSYCGKLDFGIVADRDQMPDAKTLIDYLREELALLMPKAPKRASSNGASNGKANGKAAVKKARPKATARG